jgi:type I restriction enzyme S subunit
MRTSGKTLAKVGWVQAPLQDFCLIIQGQSPPGNTYNVDGEGLPFFQGKAEFGELYPTPVKWCSSPTKIAEPADILISIRAPVGPTNLCPTRACIGRGLAAIRPLGGVHHRYVLYGLRHTAQALLDESTGSTFDAIGGKTLREHVLPLAPLNEQGLIVAEIEKQFTRLDTAIVSLKRVQAKLKRYQVAVLKAACDGRLVPTEAKLARADGRAYEPASLLLNRILTERRSRWETSELSKLKTSGKAAKDFAWKQKYKIPSAPVNANAHDAPEGWSVGSLEQLTSAVRVICYGILMPKEDVPDGVPYVRVLDLKGDRIDIQNLKRTSPAIAQTYARASLKGGDVLLAIRGSYGRVAEVPSELEGGNITQDTCRLDVSELVNHRYIATCLRGPIAQGYLKRVARGVAVKGVNIADVRLCPIPIPPYPEQKRIVVEVERRLSIIDELVTQVNADLRRAERLRQSILKNAFEGRLVSQDPHDEPATILLTRIASKLREGLPVHLRSPRMKGDVLTMLRRKESTRISIVEALRHAKSGMAPEALLNATGYEVDSIDEFYAELKMQVEAGLVEEVRSADKIAVRATQE